MATVDLSPSEQQALIEIRQAFQDVDGAPERDFDFIRYLRARKFNKWRLENTVGMLHEGLFQNALKSGAAYLHGRDKGGRPCIVLRTALHDPKTRVLEEHMKFSIWMIERAIKCFLPGQEQFTVIFDRIGFQMKHLDWPVTKGLLSLLLDNYPERLHMLHVFPVNTLFWMFFKVVQPLLDERTSKKINIIKGDYSAALATFFTPDNLEQRLGGTSTWTYTYPPVSDLYTLLHSGLDPVYNAAVSSAGGVLKSASAAEEAAAAVAAGAASSADIPTSVQQLDMSAVSEEERAALAEMIASAEDDDDVFHDVEEQ